MNTDAIVLAIIVILLISGWLPTYVIMRRKYIDLKNSNRNLESTWYLYGHEDGWNASQESKEKDAMRARLTRRRQAFPNK